MPRYCRHYYYGYHFAADAIISSPSFAAIDAADIDATPRYYAPTLFSPAIITIIISLSYYSLHFTILRRHCFAAAISS